MRRSATIALGIATVWPVAFALAVLALWMLLTWAAGTGHEMTFIDGPTTLVAMLATLVLAACTAIDAVVLAIVYIVHAFKNPELTNDRRTLWVLAIAFGAPIGAIAYWYLNLWRTPPRP